MKQLILIVCSIILFPAIPFSQTSGLGDIEPEKGIIGAPLYPGAVFVRTVEGLNPYFKSALYVTIDPIKTVEAYFERKLPEKQKAYYEYENQNITVFLLKTWSTFSGKTTKEELDKLESEPNIQIIDYNRDLYKSLIEYYESNPSGKHKSEAIRTGHTMISYIFRKVEQNTSAETIIGSWSSVDRDLPIYFKSTITFDKNGVYIFKLTPDNITALVSKLSSDRKDTIRLFIESRNPEKGTYVIMKNTITMESNAPIIEPATKIGLAKVSTKLMSLEIMGQPRLSFLKKNSK
jgi:hypothetical protein